MSLNRRLPGLVNAPSDASAQQSQWMDQVTTALRSGLGQSKNQEDKWLTWRDLEESLIVVKSTTPGGGFVPSNPPPDPPDMAPPPGLENVEASGGMTAIYVKWSDPGLNYYYHVEVHRSSQNDVGTAVMVGTTMGNIYSDLVGSDVTQYYYWVRIVKQSGGQNIIGPWHSTQGVTAKAADDPEWILDQISGKFDSDDLKTQVFSVDLFGVKSPDPDIKRFAFAVDTTVDPPIVAMDGASIITASIRDAAIGELSVDKLVGGTADWVEANIRDASITNAKIGNIIRSSNYQAGKSGWLLNKLGFLECFNIHARGTIEGSIVRGSVIEGGLLIDSGVNITTPTEADRGPGTIRFLCLLAYNYAFEKSDVNEAEFNIPSSGYKGDGYDEWGDGQTTEPVYNNFYRNIKNTIRPDIQFNADTNYYWRPDCPSPQAGSGSDFDFSLKIYGIRSNGSEILIKTVNARIKPNSTDDIIPGGRIKYTHRGATIRCYTSAGLPYDTYISAYVAFTLILDTPLDYSGDYKSIKLTASRSGTASISDRNDNYV